MPFRTDILVALQKADVGAIERRVKLADKWNLEAIGGTKSRATLAGSAYNLIIWKNTLGISLLRGSGSRPPLRLLLTCSTGLVVARAKVAFGIEWLLLNRHSEPASVNDADCE